MKAVVTSLDISNIGILHIQYPSQTIKTFEQVPVTTERNDDEYQAVSSFFSPSDSTFTL